MANSFFKFKQFTVNQAGCAMKVCTDSCIFGATIPVKNARKMLDIGTGTGLLALMAAQRNPEIKITALEIDEAAAWQATENVAASPWSDRILVKNSSLQEFEKSKPALSDLIVCNPPFYQRSLKSANQLKNQAKHTDSLEFEEIISFAKKYLQTEGALSILLPPPEMAVFEKLASEAGLLVTDSLSVYNLIHGKCIRMVQTFKRLPQPYSAQTLYIQNPDNSYTSDFKTLLKDFYLIF